MNLPQRVGVFGGGRMGAGIAHAFLAAGCHVVVIEQDEQGVLGARERVATSLTRAAQRATPSESPEVSLQRLRVVTDAARLSDADLVIEAVPEDVESKIAVLRLAEEAAADAVLATNTSSLSVDTLAQALESPERLIGLHFFNPVPVSALVEIVVGAATPVDLVTRAQAWVTALGKTAVTVRDSPGFASSRLGLVLGLEAMRMLQEGVAPAADIDAAMTLGYGHPTGPLRTSDIVGLDVRLAIAEHLEHELGPRFAPPRILRDMVADGRLGRKSGGGFYDW